MSRYTVLSAPSSETADALTGMSGAPVGQIVDLAALGDITPATVRDADLPTILLNPTEDALSAVCGIGVDCRGAVYHPRRDGAPAQLLYVPHLPDDPGTPEQGERKVEKPGEEEAPDGGGEVGDDWLAPMRATSLSASLDRLATTPLAATATTPQIDPIPDDAVGDQMIVAPDPVAYHPYIKTWKHYKNPVTLKNQTLTLALPVFVEMYASSRPKNKFVRVTAYGTGFNPGKMIWNGALERGIFQDRATVSLGLRNAPSGTALLLNEPKTKNNEATYTSSSSLTIGLKAAEGGAEPSGSATISASVTSTLSDFEVLSHSAGNGGEWQFEMRLCGDRSEGMYDIKDPGSLVDGWGTVWAVPGLARSTLFPACMAAWSFPLDCQAAVGVNLVLQQRYVYVASNRLQYYWSYNTGTARFPFTVNLGSINF